MRAIASARRATVNQHRLTFERGGGFELWTHQTAELSSNDALFAELDGQIIRGRQGTWRAEVLSILADAQETWLQIGPAERPALAIILRLVGHQQAARVLEALRAWSDLPEELRPGRIELFPTPA